MKKIIVILLALLFMAGCSSEIIEVNSYLEKELNIADCENRDFQKGVQNPDAFFENEDFSFKILQTVTFGRTVYFAAEAEKFNDFEGKQLCIDIEKLNAGEKEIKNYILSYETAFEDSEKEYYIFHFYSDENIKAGDEMTLYLNNFFIIENEYTDKEVCGPVEISWTMEKTGDIRYFQNVGEEDEIKYIEITPFSVYVEFGKPVEEIPKMAAVYHHNENKIIISGIERETDTMEGITDVRYYLDEMLDISKIKYLQIGDTRYIVK